MLRKLAYFNIVTGILVILIGLGFNFKEEIVTFYNEKGTKKFTKEVEITPQNDYYRDYDFEFVQNTTNSTPNSYQELLNLIYSIINNGYTSFSFYCGDEYAYCIDDVKSIAKSNDILSTINNYVHPYNSFDLIETGCKGDRIYFQIRHKYSDAQIEEINKKVDEIMDSTVNMNEIQMDSIRKIHNYIINNTKYDSARADSNIIDYDSDIAYGPLLEGYALCGGYTEAMELFLEKLHIKSFRVASEEHIWNAVELNNIWYNLDLTWDDPVVDTGINLLDDTYFMVDTKTMQENDMTEHDFYKEYYKELKNT
ncbi:MAG: hypothetical protein IJ193_05560 [Bacilli bacterium]|nr:hypothetical protein [Bacilli bacterium]